MTPVAFLRQMLSNGVDLETAMQAAEAFEQSAQADHDKLVAGLLDRLSVDAKAEKRRAKDRERKKAKCGIPRNSADSAETAELKKVPEPLKNNTPSPPLKGGISPFSEGSSPGKPKTAEPQKSLTVWVSAIWDQTPLKARQRSGKQLAENALKAAVRRGADPAKISGGLAAYYGSAEATKDGGEYAKGLHRAIQNNLWELFEPQGPTTPTDDDPWPLRLLRWQRAAYWDREWGPKPTEPGYRGPAQEQAA